MRRFLVLTLLLFSFQCLHAQDENVKLGIDPVSKGNINAAFYDLSDPNTVNVKISVWGYVERPGRYVVPEYSSLLDVVSSAGGPGENGDLEDVRVYRMKPDSSYELLRYNLNSLMWEKEPNISSIKNPKILPGDIVIVPGTQRFFLKDYIAITLSIASTLFSLIVLIVNLSN